jgi:predicted ABC-type ATPase
MGSFISQFPIWNDFIFFFTTDKERKGTNIPRLRRNLVLFFCAVVVHVNLLFNFVVAPEEKMPRLFIIAGCNGAGKTTASYTMMPEMLEMSELVNADEIAKGLSPFNPDSVAIQAGKIMLMRVRELIGMGADFAFETTLATKSYYYLIKEAQEKGYFVTILYLWLPSPEQAIKRVAQRVSEGGHNIPETVIRRRYRAGIKNLFNIYMPVAD